MVHTTRYHKKKERDISVVCLFFMWQDIINSCWISSSCCSIDFFSWKMLRNKFLLQFRTFSLKYFKACWNLYIFVMSCMIFSLAHHVWDSSRNYGWVSQKVSNWKGLSLRVAIVFIESWTGEWSEVDFWRMVASTKGPSRIRVSDIRKRPIVHVIWWDPIRLLDQLKGPFRVSMSTNFTLVGPIEGAISGLNVHQFEAIYEVLELDVFVVHTLRPPSLFF